ncbi:uncharacterized protein [Eurosta solidaginis]|uniref:uncharacterized protein n=1 Tax=Eurosta solidaginis TaxID=178769 RepID=UPI0035313444
MKRKLGQRKLKRWTPAEISQIIDYMTEFTNVEKPTARAYYENMLKVYPIDATWDLIKWKVRYLRVIYSKAVQWLETDEVRQMNNAQVEEKLLKMCPNYYRLYKIFGSKRAEIIEIMDSNDSFGDCSYEDMDDNADYAEDVDVDVDVKIFEEYNETANYCREDNVAITNNTDQLLGGSSVPVADDESTQTSTHQSITQPDIIRHESMQQNGEPTQVDEKRELLDDITEVKRLKKESLRNSLNALSQSQDARNEMQRLRLKFEEYKFAQEFSFIKEKFHAEQELKRQELELKKREIESNEKLRIMEMEKNERIAKYELSIKYSGQSKYSNNLHADLCG